MKAMYKRIIPIVLLLLILCSFEGCTTAETQSVAFAKQLGTGWNLGNTLDACNKTTKEKMGLESQTSWGNPETTKEMIDFVKQSGFKTVRIPITWAPHLSDSPDYSIDEAWLDKVNEIVDYVLDNGMYAIINVHHDDAFWLVTDNEHEQEATAVLTAIWSQVSERFADYDERLVFETMNEPRVTGNEYEWDGNEEYRQTVNRLNFAALETIRNSGGKNASRYVIIPTYAASVSEDNMKALELPDDNRVLIGMHFYYGTSHDGAEPDCAEKLTSSDEKNMKKTFKLMKKYFLSKGYGVVNSEFGWTDRENLDILTEKASCYVELAQEYGIPCIVWDNGGDFRLLDRNNLQWEFEDYKNAIT